MRPFLWFSFSGPGGGLSMNNRGTILPALDTGRQKALQAYERGQLDYLQWDNARQQWLSARERLLDEAEALQLQWIELQRLTGQATYF